MRDQNPLQTLILSRKRYEEAHSLVQDKTKLFLKMNADALLN